METNYDVVIVGGGAAGMTAAIYTTRQDLKTLVVTKDIGGQALMTNEIENYPGFELIAGPDLTRKIHQQAEKFGAKFDFTEAEGVRKTEDGGFVVKTKEREYAAKAVILAFGKTPRSLAVPGEEEFMGKGVSYCATCDMPLFRNKDVVVVGGGNSAIDAAILGAGIANKVYMVHRRDRLSGEQTLVKRLEEKDNVEMVFESEVRAVQGGKVVEKVVVKGAHGERELAAQGVFVEIGFEVKPDFVKGLVELDERNQIVVDKEMNTSEAGIFACGDVVDFPYKQFVISAAHGSIAGLSAYNYILGKKAKTADWG